MMNHIKVGKVTVAEKNFMLPIYNRRASLEELILTVSEKVHPDLYGKINNDLASTRIEYDNWWQKMQQKYSWKVNQNGYWIMDFNTCEVMLNEECEQANV
ncbi:CXXX repeat peptide modification system protein [Desulfosporosinus metallidurans]|uniref:CXXX repeat peptide modification system protein n=1 Tax=Desulfosporosinus metallidurans TaxID=1888891 RepID=A0A1Q8QD07_9FIRM|nr:CXXX repeat peptide modification system protein [Desulfosporosinus metallidurans]OLN25192.1 hypothetical protein DSOL_5361 [Desulfosporosinus metallidurans]